MAVCLYVSNPFSRTRLQVSNIDLQDTIAGFKSVITDTVGIQANKQELVYMGGCLEDEERSLQSYGVEGNVTIFVFEKIEENEQKEEEEAAMSLEELQALLNKARNPLYKQSVKKFIKNADGLQKAIKTIKNTALLRKDPVTSALIADQDLLLVVVDTAPAESILQHYPTLCALLKNIVSNISIDSSGRQQLYHDDDEEGEFMGIDPAFLAQAELLAANEESLQQASTSEGTPRATSSAQQQQQQRHRISASDLANALSFASMAPTGSTSTPPVSSTPPDNQEQTEIALQQMRAMGITDDDLSRRALSMSGGIVEAALNLIFEGTLI